MIAMPERRPHPCFTRNRYGLPKRNSAIAAEALYTITTLASTSSSVARNRTLSDFSFRAILHAPWALRARAPAGGDVGA